MQISYRKKWEEAKKAYELVPNKKLKEEIDMLWQQALYSGELDDLFRVPLEDYKPNLLRGVLICK